MKASTIISNVVRRMETLFPGYFPEVKHNHYADFGWPARLTFSNFQSMYMRNSIARAAIEKTVLKTWQDYPILRTSEKEHEESGIESEIRQRFSDLRLWQRLAEADRRSMVGGYAGVILRVADSKLFKEPVNRINNGLEALVEVIPAWEGQLTVSTWVTDERSEDYGKPAMFSFNEAAVGVTHGNPRSFEIHPSRVVVWSRDGTIFNHSLLEPGYNDLITLEKVSGAGGEGFWKNAKSSPVLQADKDLDIKAMASAMGVKPAELADAMNSQVEDWQKGFDKLLMIQGMEAKTLGVTLPSPEHFFNVALQSFAASVPMPLKILVGMQTGERASTEDAKEWAQTNMARRSSQVVPTIMEIVNRLEAFGILPENDWSLVWPDLTESSMVEKVDRADKMAGTNQKMKDSGEWVFTPEEIRSVVGFQPLSEKDKYREEPDDDNKDAKDALGDDK